MAVTSLPVASFFNCPREIEKYIQDLHLAEYSQNQPTPPIQKPKTLKTHGQNKRKKRRGRHKKNNY